MTSRDGGGPVLSRPRWWRAVAVAWLAVVVSWYGLAPGATRQLWLLGLLWGPIGVMVLLHRRHPPLDPGWRRLRLGLVVHGAGMTAAQLVEGLVGELLLIGATLAAFPLLRGAFRSLGRYGDSRADGSPDGEELGWRRVDELDALIVGLAVAAVWWSAVLGPDPVVLASSTTLGIIRVSSSLALVLLVLSLVVRWAFAAGGLPRYATVMSLAGIAGAAFPLVHWATGRMGDVHEGPAAPLLGLAYALVGIAAIHPSATRPGDGLGRQQDRSGARLLVICAALVVPLVLRTGCAVGADLACGAGLLGFESLLLIAVGVRLRAAILGHQRSTRRLGTRNRLFAALVENAVDGVALFTADGFVTYSTPAIEHLAGQAATGRRGVDLLHPDDIGPVMHAFREAASTRGRVVSVTARPAMIPDRWLEMRLVDRRDDPDVSAIVANVRDVTATRTHAATLRRMAYEDALTGLDNRVALLEDLTRMLEDGRRVAVLFCDLDRLKLVNDTLGHPAGDALLVTAAQRMVRVIRPDDRIGRLGGDEFLLVLPDTDAEQATTIAQRLREALSEPFSLEAGITRVSCSVGVAVADDTVDAERLVADADAALYRAKQLGRDRVVVFDAAIQHERMRRMRTQAELPGAIEAGQLDVHYQPILDPREGSMWGVEALVRWNHPTVGMLTPASFVDIAEETGLIVPLGDAVARTVVRTAAAHPELEVVSINVVGAQLESEAFPSLLEALLRDEDVDPRRLVLEVTETTLLAGTPTVVTQLQRLRDLGVRVALDDFGTGYASFATMQSLPLDILKVDQTLVGRPEDTDTVLRAVVTMAHAMDLVVIVEGIERQDQLDAALGVEADLVQGYLLGRPGDVRLLGRSIQRTGIRWEPDPTF